MFSSLLDGVCSSGENSSELFLVGCFQGSREATLEFGSSLSALPTNKETDSETMVSLGFKTSQENIPVLVQTGGMVSSSITFFPY